MNDGWIKLHRKTLKSAVSQDMTLLGCWAYLLMNANWEERQLLSGTMLKPGQMVISMERVAADWECNKSTVLRRLKKLEMLGMVQRQSQRTGTIVTICNWVTYQSRDDDDATPDATPTQHRRNDDATPTQHRRNQNKKERTKEGKKERSIYTSVFNEFWNSYPARNGRRTEKKAAFEKFKTIPKEKHDSLRLAISNYARETEPAYVKDMFRFLRSWEDWNGAPEKQKYVEQQF